MNININNNIIISKVENVKYLWVVLDDKLSWNSHIVQVNKQISYFNLSGGVALIVWFTTNGMCAKNKNSYA